MGKFHDSIKPAHKEFIETQHIFFVATAPLSADGHINLSPKGLDCFKVLSENKVGYMDLISSGNETSAHTLENGRITIMFTSFEGAPNILRLYGKGFAVLPGRLFVPSELRIDCACIGQRGHIIRPLLEDLLVFFKGDFELSLLMRLDGVFPSLLNRGALPQGRQRH